MSREFYKEPDYFEDQRRRNLRKAFTEEEPEQPVKEEITEEIPVKDEPAKEETKPSFKEAEYHNPPKRRHRHQRKERFGKLKFMAAAVLFGITAGASFVFANRLVSSFFPKPKQEIKTTVSSGKSKNTVTGTAEDVSSVVDEVMNSVVSITGIYQNSVFGFGTIESQGAGSGFIIADNDDQIFIATNNHVVNGSSELKVGFADENIVSAEVVGQDSTSDLAVISVKKKDLKEETKEKIKIAVLGDSDKLQVGQPVFAIGNALGYGQSVTTGVLSAKDREISFTDGTMNLLQTDAAINPGNSGGVLINAKGEVIGINNAKLSDTAIEGMGYAIPINAANAILNDLMNAKDITKENAGFLGIYGRNIDKTYSEALGLPEGIYVSQVIKDSPAEKADIMAGDIITAMDGNKLSTMEGLKEQISRKEAGTKIKITLKRSSKNGDYSDKDVEVTLGKAKDFEDDTDKMQKQEEKQEQNNNGQIPGFDGNDINPFGDFFGN